MAGFILLALALALAVVITAAQAETTDSSIAAESRAPIWIDAATPEPGRNRDFLEFAVGADGGLFGYGFTSVGDGFDYLKTLRLIAVKISPDGKELWRQLLPANEPLRGSGMALAPDDGLFVCDGVQNVYRLDADGVVVWHVVTGKWMDLICDEMLYHSHNLLLIAGERRFVAWPDNWRDHEAALTAFDATTGEQLWQVGYSPFDQPFQSESTVLVTADRLIWFGGGHTEGRPEYYKHGFYWSYDIGFDGRVLARTDLVQLFEEDDFAEHRQIVVNEDNQLVLVGRYPGHTGLGVMVWDAPDWRNPFEFQSGLEYLLEWESETNLGVPIIVESTDDRFTAMIVRYPDQDGERAAIGLVTKNPHKYRWFEALTIELSADFPRGTILWDRRNHRPFEPGNHFYVWQRGEKYPSYVPAKIWRVDLE